MRTGLPYILLIASLLLVALPIPAQMTRYPLSPAAVAQMLTAAGAPVALEDIDLPSILSAAEPSPRLTVTKIEPTGDSNLRLRVACVTVGECLPFFAIVKLHDKTQAEAVQSTLASCFPPILPIRAESAPLLHVGERAVLLLEDHQMRITIPVISIDTGKVGNEVRVTSLDRRLTYRGLVLEAGLVRGVLP